MWMVWLFVCFFFRGLAKVLEKYNNFTYGVCPNVFCNNQPVIPCGLSDTLGQNRTTVFCRRCNVSNKWGALQSRVCICELIIVFLLAQEVYYPRCSRLASIDGAYYGTTLPHMFFLQYEHLVSRHYLIVS